MHKRTKKAITTSEDIPKGMSIAPEMDGKSVLSVLHEDKGRIRHASAHIEEHGIEPPPTVDSVTWKNMS